MLFTNKKPDEPTIYTPAPATMPLSASQLRPAAGGVQGPCIIDAALVITGNLESDRDVQLDGEVHGDIRCTQLIVNRNATLLGNVVATEVVVRGKIKGTIRADQVMLQDTARVESDIFHKLLVVEQGAIFDGQAHRTDKDEALNPQIEALQAMSAEMRAAGQQPAAAVKAEAA